MLKPLILSWLIVLPAIVEPCHAKTLKEWEDCMGNASMGPKARQQERDTGVDGLHEYLLEVCGFKPTAGRTWLPKEDCDRLFENGGDNDCEARLCGSLSDDRYLKTLDPRAFDEDRYWALCQEIQAGGVLSRQRFGHEVCGERLAGNDAPTDAAITEKNWVSHPEIVEVRSLYQAIKAFIDAGNLQRKERKFDYCEPHEDTVRTIYMDRNGKPRLYYYEGGSDDSFIERELYYDESGKLRFAFITAGAYNGTQLEHRIYFSKAGKKIWEIQKRLEGPGWPFPTEWPELIQDPVHAFNDMSPCTEIK